MVIAKVVGILTIWIIAFIPVKAPAQDKSTASEKLMVATMVAPPFAMKTADGRWEGLSIELWQAIVQELGVEYELIEYSRIGQIMEAFEKGELDALPTMAIKASRENILDLSHSYLRSG